MQVIILTFLIGIWCGMRVDRVRSASVIGYIREWRLWVKRRRREKLEPEQGWATKMMGGLPKAGGCAVYHRTAEDIEDYMSLLNEREKYRREPLETE